MPQRRKITFGLIQSRRSEEVTTPGQRIRGLICPACGTVDDWHVTHTVKHHQFIERRRECLKCGYVVVTREKIIY